MGDGRDEDDVSPQPTKKEPITADLLAQHVDRFVG